MSTTLTPDVAAKVLQLDVANIITKSKSGKPLTRFERETVAACQAQSTAQEPATKAVEFAATKTALAAALKISRPTLNEYLRKPGAPSRTAQGWSIAEMRRFIGGATSNETLAVNLNSDLATLKKAEVMERVKKFRIQNQQRLKDLIPATEARRDAARCILATKASFLSNTDSVTAAAVMKCGLSTEQAEHLRRILSDATLASLKNLHNGAWTEAVCPECRAKL